MAYFPNAFKKIFVSSGFEPAANSQELTPGSLALYNANTWQPVLDGSPSFTNHPRVVLAMGSHHIVDKIGTHGGYKESVKSQPIDPRYVHRFWKVAGRGALAQIVQLGWDGTNAATGPAFLCGQAYNLRIDLKGSPALRFLGHHLYKTFMVTTGCCTNVGEPEAVDPIVVLLDWAKQINEDVFFSQFLFAEVYTTDGADPESDPDLVNAATYVAVTDPGAIALIKAGLRLQVAYVDTQFGNCSFDPRDHFEMEPLVVTAAQLVDESGDPCSSFKQLVFTEVQAAITAEGTGDMILRDMILFNYYRQEFYQTDPRRREIENTGVHSAITRGEVYDSLYLLYSVPRKSNPTSVTDNDLYLLQIVAPLGGNLDMLSTWLTAYFVAANNGVVLEVL